MLTCLLYLQSNAQDLPVNLVTGTPSISVPIWTVTDFDLSDNVSLNYNVLNLKLLEENEGWNGVGWSCSGGGAVSREVRGLPDDLNETAQPNRRGWLYKVGATTTTVAAEIGAFANTANAGSSDTTICSDENADKTKLAGFNYKVDNEPDIFYFNAPGLSGSFVFDNSTIPVIRLIPHQDVQVTPTIVANQITSFTIKTNNGNTYTFGQAVPFKRSIKSDLSSPVASTEAGFYSSLVTYNGMWNLTKVESASGAYIDYTYATEKSKSTESVRAGIYNDSFDPSLTKVRIKSFYDREDSVRRCYPATITASSGEKVTFTYLNETLTSIKVYDARSATPTTPVKEYALKYTTLTRYNGVYLDTYSHRSFLTSVTELSACERISPYLFEYTLPERLPDYRVVSRDVWGYYNVKDDIGSQTPYTTHLVPRLYVYPSESIENRVRLYPIPAGLYTGTEIILDGADRRPSEEGMKIGSMSKVTFPTGGILNLQFEANTYFDAKANMNQYAGGLRIKRYTYFDGVNPSGAVTKEFVYHDATTGQSYGRLIDQPSFLVPVSKYKNPDYYTQSAYDRNYATTYSTVDKWKRFTVRTERNLTDNGSAPVMYENVIVKMPGAGSVKTHFLLPGQYGSASSGAWTPTIDNFARPTATKCAPLALYAGPAAWLYPYVRNPNFDHERGLEDHIYEYNEANVLVKETFNEYQNLYRANNSPDYVYGLPYETFGYSNVTYLFGKYRLNAGVTKFLQRQTVTTYDATDVTRKLVETTEFQYEPTHLVLDKISNTKPDGSIYHSSFTYPFEIANIAATSESALLRIKDLQNAFRINKPLEVVNQYQKNAQDVLRTISAKLTVYESFSPGGVLPKYEYSLATETPLTNFAGITIDATNSQNQLLKKDTRYDRDPNKTTTAYTAKGLAVSAIGQDNIPVTVGWGYSGSVPVINASNIQTTNTSLFAFSDFETTTGYEFTITNGFYGKGYTGNNAIHPYAKLTKTVERLTGTNNYVVSFRAKNNSSTPLIVRVNLKNGATTEVTDTMKVYANNKFVYRSKTFIIPAGKTFTTIEIAGEGLSAPSASSPTLFPVIDDVAFYPQQASLLTSTYQLPFGVTSTTDQSKGQTTFNEFDGLGRPRLTRDKDLNIVSRTTYNFPTSVDLIAGVPIPATDLYTMEAITFTADDNPCVTGEKYSWEVWTTNTAGPSVMEASFNSTATRQLSFTSTASARAEYKLILTVSLAGYADQTVSVNFTVYPKPIQSILICHAGVTEMNCSTTVNSPNTCGFTVMNGWAYFKATFEDEIPAGPVYHWKTRTVGQAEWTEVGTNSATYSFKVLNTTPSTEVMCTVTASGGRTGDTMIRTVTVYCN